MLPISLAFDDDSIKQGNVERIDSSQFVPLADVADLIRRSTRHSDEFNLLIWMKSDKVILMVMHCLT